MSGRLLLGKLAVLLSVAALTACPSDPPDPPPPSPEIVLGDWVLGDTTVGAPFEKTLTVSGGTPPLTFTASGLPAGIAVSASSGALSGSATAAGDFTVTLTAKDEAGKQASKSAPLKVYEAVAFVTSALPKGTEGAPYAALVELKGGKAPLVVSVAGGELPPGIVWDDAESSLAGTPTAAGSFSFSLKVVEANAVEAVRQFTLAVAAPLTVGPDALPVGNVDKPYSAQLTSTGGNAPITFSVASGTLPPGLSLNASTGAISGTPTTGGQVGLTLAASDATGAVASKAYTLSIYANAPPNIVTTSLANGTEGVAYSQNLAATDGAPPYTWAITTGTLPAGLTLSPTGTVSGTPTAAGSANLQVEVTDSNGQKDVGAISLSVYSKLSITTASLPEAYVGGAFSETLSATGGLPPYTWSTNAASLPSGLALTSGILAGTPTQAGAFAPVFTVTDGSGQTVNKSLILTVFALPAITTTSLPNGAVNVPYSQQLQAAGGKVPYSFSITSGALPAGLVLGGDLISGTPTGPATSSVTITVSDANGKTASRTFALNVFSGLAVTSPNPPDAYVGQPYNESLTAAGGQAPYTWSIISGVLPAGLSLSGASISGSPTANANATFTVQVQDAAGTIATRALVLDVYKLPTLTSTSVPDGYATDAYSGSVVAADGKQPLTFTVTSGALPSGLNLTSGGSITGTPGAPGNGSFTVQVADANGKQVSRAFTLYVYALPSLTAPTFPDFYATEALSQTLAASGGKGPLTWTTTGTLPAQVTLSSAGLLSGAPAATAVGTFTPTATVTDANGKTAQAQLTLRVYGLPALVPGSLPDAYTGEPYSQTVGSSGGKGPNSFAVSAGALPAGFTLSATSGTISGSPTTPATAQTFTLRLTDQNGRTATQAYTVGVYAPPALSTTGFAEGYVGTAYSQPVNAIGGKAPITWTVTTGSLPAGLTLGSTAVSGTPTAAGISNFQLTATDANGRAAQQSFSISIWAPPTIATATLPDGYTNEPYSQTLAATGGKGTLSFALASGTLPAGLSLSSSGVLSGTPTTATAAATFTVRVTDANGTSSTATYTVGVYAPLNITTAALPDGYATVAYSQALALTGGKAPITWAVTGLPAGLSLSGATIGGTPTAAGSASLNVTATDVNGRTMAKPLTLAVYTLPSITTPTLPDAYTGEAYSQSVGATGGRPSLTWAVASGTLPAGLALNAATGVISGTPTTAAASVTFAIRVSDPNNKTATQSYTIGVFAPLTIATANLNDGYVGTAYTRTLIRNGGKTPIAWTVSSGNLPAGLSLSTAGNLTGPPSAAGTSNFDVTATDDNGRTAVKSLTLAVYTVPVISTASFPSTNVGASYSQTATVTGGKPGYSWAVSAGALPTGLSLAPATGVISGTPSASGSFAFTLRVADQNSVAAERDFTIVVRQMTITTASALAEGYANSPYSVTFAAQDGVAPLTWTLSAGTLPAGLSLSPSTGVLGTALGAVGNNQTHTFTVRVTDSAGQAATKVFTLVTFTTPVITAGTLTTATEGVTYLKAPATNEAFAATGGKLPLTFTATGLPAGLTVQSNGSIVGIPDQNTSGSYAVTATVTDDNGKTSSASFTLAVVAPSPIRGGGAVSVAPQGSPITDVLTVFATWPDGTGRQGMHVRVRKNGVEYGTPKQGTTDASGKVVFTGLGLNGTTDTVDITGSGYQLTNVTFAKMNASLVTLLTEYYPLPAVRAQMPAAVVNGKLFAPMGQSNGSPNVFADRGCLSSVQRLDDAGTASWSEVRAPAMPNAPSGRTGYAVASFGPYLYLFGGRDCANGASLSDLHRYDTSSNTWTLMSMGAGPQPRSGAALAADGAGRLYLIGGEDNGMYFPEVWRFDPNIGAWQTLPGPMSPDTQVAEHVAGYHAPTNSIFFCGGRSNMGHQSDCWRLDPGAMFWMSMGSLPEPRYGMQMAYNPTSGQWAIFGGTKQNPTTFMEELSNDVLVMSPGGNWSLMPTVGGIEPRREHAFGWDSTSGSFVAIGGRGIDWTPFDDLWTLNGPQWTRRTPPPRPQPTSYSLSGTINMPPSPWPTGGYVQIQVTTESGGWYYNSVWLDPGMTAAPYVVNNLPAGEAFAVSALYTANDPAAPFPGNLRNFVDLGQLPPLTGNRVQNIVFPPPLPVTQSSGTFAFPAAWTGASQVYASPYAPRPNFSPAWNGDFQYDAASRTLTAAYFKQTTQDLELSASNETACEGAYWALRNIPAGSLGTLTIPAMPTGFSPGVAECGTPTVPTVPEGSYAFTAPAGSELLFMRRGPNRQATDWIYLSPISAGPVSFSLPAPSTLGPSRGAPVGQEVAWSAYVLDMPANFSVNQFNFRTVQVEKQSIGGARLYKRQ